MVVKTRQSSKKSAVGDSIVDGSTINYNFHKRYDGISDDKIAKLTPVRFQLKEKQRMSRNAWLVAPLH